MLPRSRLLDSHSRARDLASSILSAANPPQITAACSAADDFLCQHPSADQGGPFLSTALPALLSRLFGFGEPHSPAWIELPHSNVASRLFDLLAPGGPLMSLVDTVDRKPLLRFSFPIERLPKWMGSLLLHNASSDSDISDLCPLFKSRTVVVDGKAQLHLNVFECYMFWFACYPLCKGASGNLNAAGNTGSGKSWASPWPVISSPKRQKAVSRKESELYLRLLDAYLCSFVPKLGLIGYGQQYRSSLLYYSPTAGDPSNSRAEFLVHTLICFWMVGDDFSPLPVKLCEASRVSFPTLKALGKVPPSAGLGEPLRLLVSYLNGGRSGLSGDATRVDLAGSHVPGNFNRSWNLLMQRPLYRFIARSFSFCPMGTAFEQGSHAFSLWISYLQPWKASLEYLAELNATDGIRYGGSVLKNEGKVSCDFDCTYSSAWSHYVASNFLFYSSLVVYFLNFAHMFVPNNSEALIQMTLKVIDVLTHSGELTDLLKKINSDYHPKKAEPSSFIHEEISKYIPSIHEQMEDWEDGLSQSNEGVTSLHEDSNCELKLFSSGKGGAHHLLQVLTTRMELEIGDLPGNGEAKTIQNLESIRAKMSTLFDSPASSSRSPAPTKAPPNTCPSIPGGVFTPKHPGIGGHKWADVRYRCDPMRIPISENEVAWLARNLIRLSNLLNRQLGLSDVEGGIDSPSSSFMEARQVLKDAVEGSKCGVWMLLLLFGSWLLLLFRLALRSMRERGWRINLRFLASKKLFTVMLGYVAFITLRKAFGGRQ